MKKYSRLLKYLRFYNGNIVLYFIFTLLSIIFSLVSLGTLHFFLQLKFSKEQLVLKQPQGIHSSGDLIQYINYQISHLISSNGDKGQILALALICIVVIISVLFKNVFVYLSY